MRKSIICRTLLSCRDLDFDLACLQSLIRHSYDEVKLQIFEDGSVCGACEERILSALPGATIIRRNIREEIVRDKLSAYPNCQRFLGLQKIFSMKIFDTMLYDDFDFVYVDSDIFFLKNFRFPAFSETPVFMKDSENSYCFHPIDFFKIGLPIYSQVNAGFNYFPGKAFQLPVIEELLSNEVMQKNMHHFYSEQTLWALLATKAGKTNFFDPEQVGMATNKMTITTQLLAVHLVSAHRYHFEALQRFAAENQNNSYEELRLIAAEKQLSKWEFAYSRFYKRASAYTSKLHIQKPAPGLILAEV